MWLAHSKFGGQANKNKGLMTSSFPKSAPLPLTVPPIILESQCWGRWVLRFPRGVKMLRNQGWAGGWAGARVTERGVGREEAWLVGEEWKEEVVGRADIWVLGWRA